MTRKNSAPILKKDEKIIIWDIIIPQELFLTEVPPVSDFIDIFFEFSY
jgi:hypothetical protein